MHKKGHKEEHKEHHKKESHGTKAEKAKVAHKDGAHKKHKAK